jgi:HEAT repeat protein
MQENIPFQRVLDALGEVAGTPDKMLVVLTDLAGRNLEAFEKAWRDIPQPQREKIAARLVTLLDEDTLLDFDAVFVVLLGDPAAAVRLSALAGLWESSRSGHANMVVAMMESDPDLEVRAASAYLLGNYVYQSFCGVMSRSLVDRVFPRLVAQLEEPGTPVAVRRRALEAASYGADEAVHRHIGEAYEASHGDLQISALTAMGISGDRRWLSVIMDELESPFAEMRFAAATAAGRLGDPEVIDHLMRLIEDDMPEVKAAALRALAAIGGETAQRLLATLAEDPEYDELREDIDEALEDLEWSSILDDYVLLDFEPDELFDDDDLFSEN